MPGQIFLDDARRFRSKLDMNGPMHPTDESLGRCRLWRAGTDKDGYGKFQTGTNGNQQHHRAHRFAWFLKHKRLPKALLLHSCDRPACCNHVHLFEGTQADNRADCTAKGRNATGARNGRVLHPERYGVGEAHPRAKLSDADVAEIRRLFHPRQNTGALARKFGVSISTVSAIGHGRYSRC